LLDIAIIDFAKAGTNTMAEYLNPQPISIVILEEHYEKPAVLVTELYHAPRKAQPLSISSTNLPATIPIEFKCLWNIDDFINFSSYFPHTKSIIALHHLVCTTSNSIMKK
jgi:hypothetical protein